MNQTLEAEFNDDDYEIVLGLNDKYFKKTVNDIKSNPQTLNFVYDDDNFSMIYKSNNSKLDANVIFVKGIQQKLEKNEKTESKKETKDGKDGKDAKESKADTKIKFDTTLEEDDTRHISVKTDFISVVSNAYAFDKEVSISFHSDKRIKTEMILEGGLLKIQSLIKVITAQ